MSRARHYAQSGAVNVVFQALLLIALFVVGRDLVLSGPSIVRQGVMLLLVLIPSAIWTTFFYLQDRAEPEPMRHVTVSFLAGAAGAALLAVPVQRNVFEVGSWMYESTVSLVLAAVFVIGAVTSFVLYLAVRYGFYPLDEFDEPVDGMVYGAFAGSGYAFYTSLVYLTTNPDFTVFAMGYVATTNILVYASTGSLIGYLVGRVKFSERAAGRAFATAVAVGAGLLGVYHVLNEFIFLSGAAGGFWVSFALSLAFAALILLVAYLRMRRLSGSRAIARGPTPLQFQPLLVFVVMVAIGASAGHRATGEVRFSDAEHDIRFTYPGWLTPAPVLGAGSPTDPFTERVFSAEARGESGFRVVVEVRDEVVDPEAISPLDYLGSAGRDPLTLTTEAITVDGRDALRVRYSYVRSADRARQDFARVRWAYADIVPVGERVWIARMSAAPSGFEDARESYDRILASMTWTEDGGR